MSAITPMWLAHHYPDDYDRCVVVGGHHLCRRCLVLYPVAFAVMALSLGGVHWPTRFDVAALVVLPVPAVAEFVLEHAGVLRYRPWRQVAFTIPLGVALGRGFALYVHDPTGMLFWGVVLGYSTVCLAAALLARGRTTPGYDPPMTEVVIYHNPNCSNSRQAVELLRGANVDLTIVQYLKAPLGREALEELVADLVDPVADLVRHDKRFKDLGLDPDAYTRPEAVVDLLERHPELMQRPVVVTGGTAIIARPPAERLAELLG